MRIGQVTQENYMEFIKLFGGKAPGALEQLLGKDQKVKERSEEEIHAMLIEKGYVEAGMFLREGDESWKKIVPVTDEVKERLIEMVRGHFLRNANGMSEARDGDEIGALMKEYRVNIPVEDRLSVTWTLSQISLDESRRMVNYVKAALPDWQYGQRIPADVLQAAVQGKSLDRTV